MSNASTKLSIAIGDGGAPETFKFVCGAYARSFRMEQETSDYNELDCDDPLGKPEVKVVSAKGTNFSVSFSGKASTGDFEDLSAFVDSGEPRNVRIELEPESAKIYYEGPMLLTSLDLSGTGRETVEFSAELQGAGKIERIAKT